MISLCHVSGQADSASSEEISNLKKEGGKINLSVTIMHLKIQNRLFHYLLMSVSGAAVHFSNRLIINSVARFPFLEPEVIPHFSELEDISSHQKRI